MVNCIAQLVHVVSGAFGIEAEITFVLLEALATLSYPLLFLVKWFLRQTHKFLVHAQTFLEKHLWGHLPNTTHRNKPLHPTIT